MFHFPTITQTRSRTKTLFFPLQLLSCVLVNNAWHLILWLILHTFFPFFYFCDILLFHHKYVEACWPPSPSMINRPFKEALVCFSPSLYGKKQQLCLISWNVISNRSFCQWHWLCIWTDMRCISRNQISVSPSSFVPTLIIWSFLLRALQVSVQLVYRLREGVLEVWHVSLPQIYGCFHTNVSGESRLSLLSPSHTRARSHLDMNRRLTFRATLRSSFIQIEPPPHLHSAAAVLYWYHQRMQMNLGDGGAAAV